MLGNNAIDKEQGGMLDNNAIDKEQGGMLDNKDIFVKKVKENNDTIKALAPGLRKSRERSKTNWSQLRSNRVS